jgi:hypothetical protein
MWRMISGSLVWKICGSMWVEDKWNNEDGRYADHCGWTICGSIWVEDMWINLGGRNMDQCGWMISGLM